MMLSLLLLLLPVAAASGWMAAKRNLQANCPEQKEKFVKDYMVGLNYLLNEQPDKAVDTFIKMIEVDSETVETHLTLGALFRRRGEVDRAIRVHQNLIARPQLPKKQRIGALLALGQDYLKAGVLDRAERLFLEVIETDSEYKILALGYLLDIYEQQKQWSSAISIAQKLIAQGQDVQKNIAHYYCELTVQARTLGKAEEASAYIKQAIEADANCVRASLLWGEYELLQNNFVGALQAYQKVKAQDPHYISETIAPLSICYEQLGRTHELQTYLTNCAEDYPHISVLLALVELIKNNQGVSEAAEFLATCLRKNASVQGLHHLVSLHLENAVTPIKNNLLILQDLTQRLLKNKPDYHCDQCGFSSKVLVWHCPGCREWGGVRMVESI